MSEGYQAHGPSDQGVYSKLVYQIHTQGLSGVLRIENGNRSRSFHYLGGLPVLFSTTLPEEQLQKTLVFGSLITKSRLTKLLNRIDPNTPIEEAVLKNRLVRRKQLEQHMLSRLKNGLGAPLHWSDGNWHFRSCPQLESIQIDLELLPKVSTLESLWSGVQQHISMDKVMDLVRFGKNTDSDENAPKTWSAVEDIEKKLTGFNLQHPYDQIKTMLGSNIGPDEILSKLPDPTGNLVKLLWLLENIGILRPDGLPENRDIELALKNAATGKTSEEARPETPAEEAGSERPTTRRKRKTRKRKAPVALPRHVQAPSRLSPAEAIAQDHRDRLNSDYYTFLQLPTSCTTSEIEATCKRLAQRWRSAANSANLEERARQQAKELLGGLRQVWAIFKDEFARRGYDQRLDMGAAPMVRTEATVELNQILGDLPGGTVPKEDVAPETSLFEQGKQLLEDQKFQAAYHVLDRARQEEPSDPDILSSLGWAAYHIKHQEKLEDDPEDYLKLALTFEPNHHQALEFLARISLKKGDMTRAEEILGRLVKVNPEANWANRELQQIRTAQTKEPSRRFWRRGDD